MLRSTKTHQRAITDVYAVRTDYLDRHPAQVNGFIQGLVEGTRAFKKLARAKNERGQEYRNIIEMSAEILLGSRELSADMEGLYKDIRLVSFSSNRLFFEDPKMATHIDKFTDRLQSLMIESGLLNERIVLQHKKWDIPKKNVITN